MTQRPECRVHQREACQLDTTLMPIATDELRWPGVIHDISQGGIGVFLPRRFEPGAILVVEIAGSSASALLARVIHIKPVRGGWFLGCEFLRSLDEGQVNTVTT